MTTSDQPSFRMVIENGRLVPATPFDQERLLTWRNGTEVRVSFVAADHPLIRKWWAILNLVVKQCNTPWMNAEQASEGIKLALGINHLGKTVGGRYMHYPRSLKELSDPELEDAVNDMMDVVQRLTGVDPATLRKEAKTETEA